MTTRDLAPDRNSFRTGRESRRYAEFRSILFVGFSEVLRRLRPEKGKFGGREFSALSKPISGPELRLTTHRGPQSALDGFSTLRESTEFFWTSVDRSVENHPAAEWTLDGVERLCHNPLVYAMLVEDVFAAHELSELLPITEAVVQADRTMPIFAHIRSAHFLYEPVVIIYLVHA